MFEALDPSHIADKVFPLIALYSFPFLIRQVWYFIHPVFSFRKNLIERTFMCVRLCGWITAPKRGELFNAPFSIIV